MHEIRMLSSGVCTPRVDSREAPKINFFCLSYCVICCEVETKSAIANVRKRKTMSKVLELTI